MAFDPLTGVRIKIERAEKHITDLVAECDAFIKLYPYEIVGEQNPDTRKYVVTCRVPKPPPLEWGAVAGDAIHNLRSALDTLWRLIEFSNTTKFRTARSDFPFFQTSKDLEVRSARIVKQPRLKAAVNIVKEIKSQKLRSKNLELLATLDTEDKHRGLIPAYASVHNLTLHVTSIDPPGTGSSLVHYPAKPICPIEDGTILGQFGIVSINLRLSAKMQVQPQVTIFVAFGELEIVKGHAIVPMLRQFADLTNGIVHAIAPLLS
jgi:hypothetical protein